MFLSFNYRIIRNKIWRNHVTNCANTDVSLIWAWLFSKVVNTGITLNSRGHCRVSHRSFREREMERRARDQVSRKSVFRGEEGHDEAPSSRANGLANNFVSVSLVLSFVILPRHVLRSFSFLLSQSETISFSSSANCLVSFQLDFLDRAR